MFRKSSTAALQGLHLQGERLHWALVRTSRGVPRLAHCASLATGDTPSEVLAELAARYDARQIPVAAVLNPGEYQLLLLDAPEVPATELRDAMRWKIRELIDYPIEEAVLDVFDAPASPARAQRQLYTVVARRERIDRLAQLVEAAGLHLSAVDIPELALRNLGARLPAAASGLTLLCLMPDAALIALLRGEMLHLARTIDLKIAETPDPNALADTLALEVQRTLDYHERHFRAGSFPRLAIAWQHPPLSGLTEGLHERLGMAVETLDPCRAVACEEDLAHDCLATALLAIAGGLRQSDDA